jgi:cytochrome P450
MSWSRSSVPGREGLARRRMPPGGSARIPHVPRLTAIRDSPEMIRHPVRVFERYRAQLGSTFTFHFGGARGAFVTTEPRVIEHVLKSNSENYHMSDIRVRRMAEFQGRGLLNSHGEAWLRQRRFLAQGLRRSRLAALLPYQVSLVDETLDRLDGVGAKGPVEIYPFMVRLTFRLVGRALLGHGLTDAQIDRLGSAISTIQAFMVRQIVQPYRIPWYRVSGASRRHQRLREEGDRIVRDLIATRQREGGEGGGGEGDLLQVLLGTPYRDSGERMTAEQVLIESMQLLVAGNETSPVTLAWTLALLARHPAWMERVRDEADDVFGGGPVTLAGLHRMHVTLRVLDEAMRLYPPFWMIDRVALADDEVEGLRIPAGFTVVPYIYGTHRNPEIWTDPERFDPDRFLPEAKGERHPFSHLPFGGGPRICIGSNLAILQMLLVLSAFVRRYEVELVGEAFPEIAPMMILRPGGGIPMHVRRRGSAR